MEAVDLKVNTARVSQGLWWWARCVEGWATVNTTIRRCAAAGTTHTLPSPQNWSSHGMTSLGVGTLIVPLLCLYLEHKYRPKFL